MNDPEVLLSLWRIFSNMPFSDCLLFVLFSLHCFFPFCPETILVALYNIPKPTAALSVSVCAEHSKPAAVLSVSVCAEHSKPTAVLSVSVCAEHSKPTAVLSVSVCAEHSKPTAVLSVSVCAELYYFLLFHLHVCLKRVLYVCMSMNEMQF